MAHQCDFSCNHDPIPDQVQDNSNTSHQPVTSKKIVLSKRPSDTVLKRWFRMMGLKSEDVPTLKEKKMDDKGIIVNNPYLLVCSKDKKRLASFCHGVLFGGGKAITNPQKPFKQGEHFAAYLKLPRMGSHEVIVIEETNVTRLMDERDIEKAEIVEQVIELLSFDTTDDLETQAEQ